MDGFTIVNILGAFLIITSLVIVLEKAPRKAAYGYIVQSLVLIGCFLALAVTTGSVELYEWSVTAFVTKVVVVPSVIIFLSRKIADAGSELEPKLTATKAIVLVAVEVAICFIAVQNIDLPAAVEVKPALAISLAHFFIGLTCIITQRNVVKQIFGYCLMENGSHLTLALLASNAPALVEIGVATDAFFAVIILSVLAYRLYRVAHTVNADDLTELKG